MRDRAVWKDYWLRTWGARGLLHVWDEAATHALAAGLDDEEWRPAEMCLEVVARHEVAGAGDGAAALAEHDLPRVRRAASVPVMRYPSGSTSRSSRDEFLPLPPPVDRTAPPDAVQQVLVDLRRYPECWPQVVALARIDDDHARVLCRSRLPESVDLAPLRRSECRIVAGSPDELAADGGRRATGGH